MSTDRTSLAWARTIVEALTVAGVDTVCIAPGSRSTPLVLAAHDHQAVTTLSIIDERSAGYFALGRAKRTHEPVAVVTTSGTATANLHPAVIEADQSRTPLIVCTADRPRRLYESGANQTVPQNQLYGSAVRAAPELPDPSTDKFALDALGTTVTTAVARSRGPEPGPVHLNVPLPKPLAPPPTGSIDSSVSKGSTPRVTVPQVAPDRNAIDIVVDALTDATRPLIVAGPNVQPDVVESIGSFLQETKLPVLADPLSGLRFSSLTAETTVLSGYDAYLDPDLDVAPAPPDLVLRVGGAPTSQHAQSYLGSADTRSILVDSAGSYADPTFASDTLVTASPALLFEQLSAVTDPDAMSDWIDRLKTLESAYWTNLGSDPDRLPPEGLVAQSTLRHAPDGGTVFISSSMPVRDVDRFAQTRSTPLTVIGNRGASGIDGIVSSGLGAASATSKPTIVLLGDIAAYHDMNGLLTIKRCHVDATFVVVNNDGGGIFEMLPIAEHDPPFTEHFRSPHGIDFSDVASLYDLTYERTTPAEFGERLEGVVSTSGSTLIEVHVDGSANHRLRSAFQEAVGSTLAEGG